MNNKAKEAGTKVFQPTKKPNYPRKRSREVFRNS